MGDGFIILFQLIAWVVMGFICAAIAKNRGRNPLGWFFIGIVGGCIGLILVLVLPDLNQEQESMQREKRRRRRLEEELAQERMKNQAFRGHATNRLDAHDQQLGVDTRSSAASTLPPPPVPPSLDEGVPAQGWYIALPGGSESDGPYSLEQMKQRIGAGEIAEKTLVWHESLDDWVPLGTSPLHPYLA